MRHHIRLKTIKNMILVLLYWTIVVGITDAVIQNQNGIKQFGICPAEETKIKTLLMLSLDDCIQECVVRPACKVIGYRRLSKMCQLHTNSTCNSIHVIDRSCVQVQMNTIPTIYPPNGCIGQCKGWETCDIASGLCVIKECGPFQGDATITQIVGNMNDIGAIKHFQVNNSPQESYCIRNGSWSRIVKYNMMSNIALNKQAELSSTRSPSSGAMLGIDGIKCQDFFSHPCFHTMEEFNPWWMVDLANDWLINKYVIYNRLDNGNNIRAHDIEISFGHSADVLTVVDFIPGVLPDIYNKTLTPALSTRYVKILIRSSNPSSVDILNLCEVEVYGFRNVALNKSTEQSSNFYGLSSNLAVDGDANQMLVAGRSCFHTNEESNPWWLVDLLDLFYISRIVIFNRIDDAMGYRAHDIEVHFGYDRSTLFLVDFIPGILPSVFTKDFTLDMLTRFAKLSIVSINGQIDYFHLCEVELYGYPVS